MAVDVVVAVAVVVVDGKPPATATSTTTPFRGYRGIVDQVAQRAVAG